MASSEAEFNSNSYSYASTNRIRFKGCFSGRSHPLGRKDFNTEVFYLQELLRNLAVQSMLQAFLGIAFYYGVT